MRIDLAEVYCTDLQCFEVCSAIVAYHCLTALAEIYQNTDLRNFEICNVEVTFHSLRVLVEEEQIALH